MQRALGCVGHLRGVFLIAIAVSVRSAALVIAGSIGRRRIGIRVDIRERGITGDRIHFFLCVVLGSNYCNSVWVDNVCAVFTLCCTFIKASFLYFLLLVLLL